MNYGAIGHVMGHEFTHGFDDAGRRLDKYGNLFDWWEPEIKKRYLERAQCIIDQYSNYTAEEVGLNVRNRVIDFIEFRMTKKLMFFSFWSQLNGVNTLGENIADNGGLKESYLAYNTWEAENGVEPRLPGLLYTSQQMFWLSAANMWCKITTPEGLKNQIITDPHSPSKFRINGPLSNIPEFAKAFNCPLGSTMNPEKKCSVW